jgi:DNA polymerase-3 subunit delta'
VVKLLVDAEGNWPLPWLQSPLGQALSAQRGHALLVHGAPGVGSLPFALTLGQAWLCEADAATSGLGPCGRCSSCRMVQGHLHPDLQVLLPETLRIEHGWPLPQDKPEAEEGRRKPSRQIRIDEVRALIAWSQRTSGRGQGKVAVLHPAEALNPQSANALLKTLEEPPAGTRIVLTCSDPALLLPTVRSRCQPLRLAEPATEVALAWLRGLGVEAAEVLLAACAGRPLEALALAQAGVDGAAWSALPAAVARGQAAALTAWPLPRALDALLKLCHDALARAAGGLPRYFAHAAVPAHGRPAALAAWAQEIQRVVRHADHPWQEALLLEALVLRGAAALAPADIPHAGPGHRSDTLRR